MVPKNQRISRETFEKIMKKGAITHGSLFSLRFLKNPLNTSNFSVVVAKKVAKTAVMRNKIRRRAYSILRKNVKNPYFAILFAKKGVEKGAFNEFKADIENLLKKTKIL